MHKITLKNIQSNERMSDETPAFTADLYLDGERIAMVMNHGHGGCNDYDFAKNAEWTVETLSKMVKETFPKTLNPYSNEMDEEDLDSLIFGIVYAHMDAKKFRRSFKTKILVKEGQTIREFGYKGCKQLTDAHWASFEKQHPELMSKVLNKLSDEALLEALKEM